MSDPSQTPFSEMSFPCGLGHETYDIIDASKLKTFIRCPRDFLFKYVFGWRGDEPNVHIIFGKAVHEGLEYLMSTQDGTKMGYTEEEIVRAFELFCAAYDEEYPAFSGLFEMDPNAGTAKDKTNAFAAFMQYKGRYADDQFRTLWTEVAGFVPILPDGSRGLHFRLDSIVETEIGIVSFEHKTTGRDTQAWRSQWELDLQCALYNHALYSHYGEDAGGVVINGLILRQPTKYSKGNDFVRIPVTKTPEQMMSFLQQVNHIYDDLTWNMEQLSRATPDQPTLNAFFPNPEGCQAYGCRYAGMCSHWTNPLKRAETPPAGLSQQFWDPRTYEQPNAVMDEKGIEAAAPAQTTNDDEAA